MARAAGEDLTQALGFIAKTACAFGQMFFHGIVGVDIVNWAETGLRLWFPTSKPVDAEWIHCGELSTTPHNEACRTQDPVVPAHATHSLQGSQNNL